MFRLSLILLVAFAGSAAHAQHPLRSPVDAEEIRFARSQPVVGYTLRVDSADLSAVSVEMRLRNVPDTFRLAMAAHPEYDDRYWRYVEEARAEGGGGRAATVTREDSALWRVVASGGEAVVRYRVRFAPPEGAVRGAWRPFVTPTGALIGGPHHFMYVVGATLAPVHVRLELPVGWDVATGLVPTADPHTFFAPSADVLVDSPVLAGRLRSWRFAVDGVPHRVVYWPRPDATPFDTVALVGNVERLARQAIALFGRAPYREFTFLFQDGAYGGLEHLNSTTLGAPSEELARDPVPLLGDAAHEYVHTWNLMRIRPIERTGIDYRPARQGTGLWFSEGLTMYYADLLLRRAGIPLGDSTRLAHLERSIARYLANPGNSRISPERASLAEYGSQPGSLGDYDPSPHLQGEMIGAMLDLVIRAATGSRRSMDDVMRLMLERHSGARGFTTRDVERAVADVCGCVVRPFFDAYVRRAGAIDFDGFLRLAGLRTRVAWVPALGGDGRPAPDLRLRAWSPPGERSLSLIVTDPASAWGRAGLHTRDRLTSLNGAPVGSWPELRRVLGAARIGDTLRVEVARPSGPWRTAVVVSGFDRPEVRVEEIRGVTARQRGVRDRWLAGAP